MPTPLEVVLPIGVLGSCVGFVLNALAWSVPRRTSEDDSVGRRYRPAVRRPILELGTGLLFAAVAARFGPTWSLPAYLAFAATAVVLSVIDTQHRLLPNAIVYPAFLLGIALLTVAAIGDGQPGRLLRAGLAALVLFGFFLVSTLVSPRSVGMGDVKLSAVVGLYLGYQGWSALLIGILAGFVIAAVVGIALLIARRASRTTLVPFGPSMLAGAAIAIAVTTPLSDGYLAIQQLWA